MTRQLSTRVWLAILALSVGVVVACSSSSTPEPEEKDSGTVSSSKGHSTMTKS